MRRLRFLPLFLFQYLFSPAQSCQLSGEVKDQYDNAVPYATVISKKDEKNYAVADKYGNYRLHIRSSDDTIVCSHVAFLAKEEKIEGNTVINFYLAKRPLEPYVVTLERQGKSPSVSGPNNTPGSFLHSSGVEISSQYPGGVTAFQQTLRGLIVGSKQAVNERTSGAVKVGFAVERDGTVTEVKLIKGINDDCNQAVMSAVTKTKWYAAEQNGIKVKSHQELLVIF